MNVRFEEQGTLCVVDLVGELVGESVDQVRRACLERVQAGVNNLILDLSETVLIDSCGLETLLDLADATTLRGGRCVIAAPDAAVRSVLEITRLHERMEIHAGVEQAARLVR